MAELCGIENDVAAIWPPGEWRELNVVVAVSGGADSTALLLALKRLSAGDTPRLIAAHFNHRWRDESDADETFVRELCESLGIPLQVARAEDGMPTSTGDGMEAAAREIRYAFLMETARGCGARYVAVAQTADDQVETVLHRIVRGTGISGLAGMPRVRPLVEGVTLIRPLLDVRRERVLDYLASLGQSYRSDASNLDTSFTRARIRQQLLPHLRDAYNPNVDQALLRLSRLAGESESVIEQQLEPLLQSAVLATSTELQLDCSALAGVSPYLIRELLVRVWKLQGWPQQAMSFERWDELAAMTESGARSSIRRDFPGGVTAVRENDRLTLSAVQ